MTPDDLRLRLAWREGPTSLDDCALALRRTLDILRQAHDSLALWKGSPEDKCEADAYLDERTAPRTPWHPVEETLAGLKAELLAGRNFRDSDDVPIPDWGVFGSVHDPRNGPSLVLHDQL